MSDYKLVKASKLKLRGDSSGGKKKSHAPKKSVFESAEIVASSSKDRSSSSSSGGAATGASKKLEAAAAADSHRVDFKHHIWWTISATDQLRGDILFETESGRYILAVDNGTLTTGPLHDPEDPNAPSPEEVFAVVAPAPGQLALRSPYGRYLTATSDGKVHAQTEAVGTREIWEAIPVSDEEGCFAFRNTFTTKFLTAGLNGNISAGAAEIGPQERFYVRSNKPYHEAVKRRASDDEGASEVTRISPDDASALANFATSISRKYQAVAAKDPSKIKIDSETLREFKKARVEGDIHEKLLDLRAKIKGDKYCK